MPSAWRFRPRSRQFDEREIVIDQRNFRYGLFEDNPGNPVPPNSVIKLENRRNMGNHLPVRGGCKKWSNTTIPSLVTTSNAVTSISGNVRTIIITGTLDEDKNYAVGNWFVFDSGIHERILSRTVTATPVPTVTLTTRTIQTSGDTTNANGWAHGARNGTHFNEKYKKHFFHIGRKLYYTSINISSFTECTRNCYDQLPNSRSRFYDFNNWILIACAGMLFRLDVSDGRYVYYRINTRGPTTKLTGSGTDGVGTPYGYRCTYTVSRLSGTGNRDRETLGVKIESESPPVKWDSGDWGDYWQANQIGTSYPISIMPLTCPIDKIDENTCQQHWTHYSIYRTDEMYTEGSGDLKKETTNRNILYWVADVPIISVYKAAISTASGVISATISSGYGSFYASDVGNYLSFYDGANFYQYLIATYSSASVVTVTKALGAEPDTISAQACGIGLGLYSDLRLCTQSGTTITNSGTQTSWASTDVGKTIYWADGTQAIIKTYLTTATITVDTSVTKAACPCAVDPGTRIYKDSITTTHLKENHAKWIMTNRAWEEISTGNIIAVSHGKLFMGMHGENLLYYGLLPENYEYLAGYYHPKYHYLNLKDSLTGLEVSGDKLVIFEKSRTEGAPLASDALIRDDSIMLEVYYIPTIQDIDTTVGLCHPGAKKKTDRGIIYFFDKDKQLRSYNGAQVSANLAESRIMDTLRGVQTLFAMGYDLMSGITFWANKGRSS